MKLAGVRDRRTGKNMHTTTQHEVQLQRRIDMTLTATVLALALVGGDPKPTAAQAMMAAPTHACVAADRTGTFRVVTKKNGITDIGLGVIILENIDGCLEATFITDNATPAVIDGLTLSGNTLNGALKLSTGSAKLSLLFAGASVEGSIVQGRNRWTVQGRKTS
jgi:hypothetical protein